MRSGPVVVLAALLSMGAVAAAMVTTAGEVSYLPPDDDAALRRLFDPSLERLGLALSRGGLQEAPGGGRHLAVYVEPAGEAEPSARRSLETLVTSAQVFLPRVFDRWPDLTSMDVCQERPPAPPVTVLEVGREGARTVVWETLDLPGLIVASDARLVRLVVDPEIRTDPLWRAAEAAAGRRRVPG